MNARNEENMRELFEKFVNSEEAKKSVEDIRKGEEILRKHPAPEPNEKLIADIKAEIERELLSRKTGISRRVIFKTASIAAAFIILAVVSVKLFEKASVRPGTVTIISGAIWDSNNIATDDADLATFNTEVEQIEGEALALQLGENSGNGSGDLAELEIELMEINSDFWKG